MTWTGSVPSVDSRVIYVSNSIGSDSNDGLSEITPKKTIGAGLALMRANMPDWVMLKKGDTFPDENDPRIERSGRSESEPAVITSYGSGEKPIMINDRLWAGSSTIPLKHLVIDDLHIYAATNDPSSPDYLNGVASHWGIAFIYQGSGASLSDNIIIQDCRVRFHNNPLRLSGGDVNNLMNGVTVRRCSIEDAADFGILTSHLNNFHFHDNVLVRNGWDERTTLLHNAYFTDVQNLICENNLFHKGGNMSLKFSSNFEGAATNFVIRNNIFNRGMVGMGHAALNGSWNPLTEYSHQSGEIYNNVMSNTGKNLPFDSPTSYQSIGFNIGNISGVMFSGNLFVHNGEILAGGEIFRFADPATERSANVTCVDNVVWNWLSSTRNNTGSYIINSSGVTNLVQINNLQENVAYSFPQRSVALYASGLGQTEDEFFYAAGQDITNPIYSADTIIDWIKEGFTLAGRYINIISNNLYYTIKTDT